MAIGTRRAGDERSRTATRCRSPSSLATSDTELPTTRRATFPSGRLLHRDWVRYAPMIPSPVGGVKRLGKIPCEDLGRKLDKRRGIWVQVDFPRLTPPCIVRAGPRRVGRKNRKRG